MDICIAPLLFQIILLWIYAASWWIGLYQWSMRFGTMMREEMATSQIGEEKIGPQKGEAAIVGDLQVLMAGVWRGLVLIMAVVPALIESLNGGAVLIMEELKVLLMRDTVAAGELYWRSYLTANDFLAPGFASLANHALPQLCWLQSLTSKARKIIRRNFNSANLHIILFWR